MLHHADAVTFDDLRRLLALEPLDPTLEPHQAATRWRGQAQAHPADRMFGGLLLAQAVASAGGTVDRGQELLSLQADFLLGVPTDRPMTWVVEPLSNASSMSTRRSTVHDPDSGAPLFTATTRWSTTRDDMPSRKPRRPRPAPEPETLPTLVERFGGDERIPPWWRIERPVDMRHAETPSYLAPTLPPSDEQTTWLRSTQPLPDDPVLRAALVAYVTDMSVLEPVFRALGSARHAPGSRILSLTHALTFHGPVDLSEWIQLDARLEAMTHGRTLGVADLFAGDRHVATASQLGLVKPAPV